MGVAFYFTHRFLTNVSVSSPFFELAYHVRRKLIGKQGSSSEEGKATLEKTDSPTDEAKAESHFPSEGIRMTRMVWTRLPLLRVGKKVRLAGWDGSGRGVGEGGDLWFLSDAGEDGDRRHFAVGWGCREVFEEVLVYSGKDCLAGTASTRSWRSVGRSWGRRMISNRLRESGKCKTMFETPDMVWTWYEDGDLWRGRLSQFSLSSSFSFV